MQSSLDVCSIGKLVKVQVDRDVLSDAGGDCHRAMVI